MLVEMNPSSGGGSGIAATLSWWAIFGTNGSHFIFCDKNGNETDQNVPYNVTAQTAGVRLDNEYVTVTAVQGANTFANIYLKKPCVAYYQEAAINTAAGFQTAQTKMELYAGATLTKYNSWTVAHLFFYD